MNEAKDTKMPPIRIRIRSERTDKPISDLFKFVNLNEQDNEGNTILHLAAKSKNSSGILILLKRGANIELTNKAGRTPLHEAIKHGAASDIIKRLITPNIINLTDRDGYSPLMLAASLQRHWIVHVLLRNGADVTQQSGCGDALHLACANDNNVTVIQQLIHAGADWKKKVGCRGMNALATAVFNKANINARYIMDNIIVEPSDLYEQDDNGNFIFHMAAESGNVEMLRYCIDSGMDVNLRNNNGGHIMHKLSDSNVGCMKFLIEWVGGIDMFRRLPRNKDGETPLHYLACGGDLEALQLFLSTDPPLDDQDNNGVTALSLATEMGHYKAAVLLLEKGADASIPDKNGLLPAHKCSSSECKLHILLCHPEIRDFSGCTLCSGTTE